MSSVLQWDSEASSPCIQSGNGRWFAVSLSEPLDAPYQSTLHSTVGQPLASLCACGPTHLGLLGYDLLKTVSKCVPSSGDMHDMLFKMTELAVSAIAEHR